MDNTLNKSLDDKTLFTYIILLSIFVSSYVLAPLLAVKIVSVGPLNLPAGDFIYALTFLSTDIINELYGKKYARKVVICGLISLVVFAFTQLSVILPSPDFWEDEKAYNMFFDTGFRIFLATLCAYIISQFADIYIFSWIRRKTNEKHLWVRNNISTLIARLLDAVVFMFIAFYGIYEIQEIGSLIIGAYTAGVVISLLDTPIIYVIINLLKKYNINLRKSTK